ncbi:MAG: hypothetical protein ACAI44_00355 [Candidatus Sericytochromatia bacterium]
MNQIPDEQLLAEIGVPAQTVVAWADEFKIPLPEKYQRNALQVLRLVKDLKDKNCGYRTIQRQIQMDYPEVRDDQGARETQIEDLAGHFGTLRNELLELSELAEKYAQANYTIGQMSIRMQQMELENERLKAQLRILPSPEAWEAIQLRENTYKNLLQSLQLRIQLLEDQVRELSGKPQPRSLPELPALELELRQLQLPFEQE